MKEERFTRKTDIHTTSSMVVRGTYQEGVTKEEVEQVIKGSFGGRFKFFKNGKYEYIAYTD